MDWQVVLQELVTNGARIAILVPAIIIPLMVVLALLTDSRLLEQIARETGASIGGTLYPGALSGPDGPAPTYLDMMRHNFRKLVEALGVS